jgi:uncharacterized protein YgbK (DUF1537 family)
MPYDESVIRRGSSVVAVLDDDPTGTQLVSDMPVVLDWSPEVLRRLSAGPFHVLTNSRAYSGPRAYALTYDAARAVRARFPEAHIVLRGDSTLRAHVHEEYEAVADAVYGGFRPPLLLVPALPDAGRITLDGIHVLRRGFQHVPVSETEYARDGRFRYTSSRLLDWADERSGSALAANRGVEVPLWKLRATGAAAVRDALATCARVRVGAVCVPDVETMDDLALIAEGLEAARRSGLPVVTRAAPSFAALLGGRRATEQVPAPHANSLLVICGSYVDRTTRQLRRLCQRRGAVPVDADVAALLGSGRAVEIARLAREARRALVLHRLAIIATPRQRLAIADDHQSSLALARALAEVVRPLAGDYDVVALKGGITSAVGLRDGLDGRSAIVEGPIASGVALWRLDNGRRCLVVPGNVGNDDLLADLVDAVLA